MSDNSKTLQQIQFLKVNVNIDAKASTEAADKAVSQVASSASKALIFLAICIGVAVLIPSVTYAVFTFMDIKSP